MLATRRRKALAAVAVLALVIVAAALAAWFVSANGSGSAKAGTLVAPTVTAATSPIGDLFPGPSPTGTLSLQISNPNSDLVLAAVSSTGPATVTSGSCNGVTVDVPVITGLTLPVPSGSSRVDIPGAVRLSSGAPSGCQGAEFSIPVAVDFSTP
jgi:hypothetical protein